MRVRAGATAIMRLTGGPVGGAVAYSIGFRGSTVVGSTAAGVVEWPTNSGCFEAAFLAPSAEVPHSFAWLAAGAWTFDDLEVGPTDDTIATQVAALSLAGAANVGLTAPVASSGALVLYQGNAYLNADGRAPAWTSTSWPVLTSGVVGLNIAYGATTISKTGTIDAARSVHVDLAATDTAALTAGWPYRYSLTATLADNSYITLARSGLSVLPA